MAQILKIVAFFALLSIFSSVAEAENRVVCYFSSWAVYRQNGGKFDVEDIDPTLCTHLIFSFVGLGEGASIKVLDPWNELYTDYGKGALVRFNNLKIKAPGLKTLVAIGGDGEGSVKYSQTFASAANREIFTKNAVAFIQQYGFDGLDLDWEYPGQRGGAASDKEAYTELIKTLRAEFDKHGYLLTAAVAVAEFSMIQSYDAKALSTYLDFINVMAYDFHGTWEKVTGHNAPLYTSAVEKGTFNEKLNIADSIQTWIKYGASPEKLVIGVGFYGRSFTLTSTSCSLPRCPMSAPGLAGPSTEQAGFMGYNEICKLEPASVLKFDEEAQVSYLVKGDQWISYDDLHSAQTKVDYILNNKLGGAMVWTIDTDDFKGDCGNGVFPILNLLNKGMKQGTITEENTTTSTTTTLAPVPTTASPSTTSSTTTSAPVTTGAPSTTTTSAPTTTTVASTTTTTKAPTTTVAPGSSSNPCTRSGYIRDATKCNVFYVCTLVNNAYKYSTFTCSGVLVFDTKNNVCNYPQNVVC